MIAYSSSAFFDMCVEACRPRYCGDSIKVMPSALYACLNKNIEVNNMSTISLTAKKHLNSKTIQKNSEDSDSSDENVDDENETLLPLHEWGSYEIDSTIPLNAIPEMEERGSDSASQHSAHSFSFMSRSMELLETYLENGRQRKPSIEPDIQLSVSLDKSHVIKFGNQVDRKQSHPNNATSSPQHYKTEERQSNSVEGICEQLRCEMNLYDANAFLKVTEEIPSAPAMVSANSSLRFGKR